MNSDRSHLTKVPGKAPTGIAGLDEITGGGLPHGRTTLLLGGPGSGKTILSLQFLAHGATVCKEPGIFVAFEETLRQRIVANAASFGWNLKELRQQGRLFFLDAQPTPDLVQSGNFDLNGMLAALAAVCRHEATEQSLGKIKARVDAGKLSAGQEIGLRVGKVVNQYKVAKHFELAITDNTFTFARKSESVAAEAALDGIYIIRTSVPSEQMDAPQCVRSYKSLSNVERAFRSFKTIDLKVRPIHHRLADRVRAHILLCMLAYYVEWHMREAWRELMFADTEQQAKATRDPVAPAKRSKSALSKASTHSLDDDTSVHSFSTLIAEMATIARNTCRTPGAAENAPSFTVHTSANAKQKHALELIGQIAL